MGSIPLFGKEGIGEIFRTNVFSIMDSLVNHKKIWKETSLRPLKGGEIRRVPSPLVGEG